MLFISPGAAGLNRQKKCAVKASLFFIHYLGSQDCKASAIWLVFPRLLGALLLRDKA